MTNEENFDQIYYEPYEYHPPMMQNISVLLKIKPKRLSKLSKFFFIKVIDEKKRIKQYKVMK
jgi:hypothetical protein